MAYMSHRECGGKWTTSQRIHSQWFYPLRCMMNRTICMTIMCLKKRSSMGSYNVYDCTMIELDRHHSDRKGDLSVVENRITVPFDVKRVYYLYDVPGGESRGAHAHKELSQLIIAANGSFRVTLDDGNVKRSFILNRAYQALYVKPGIWRNLDDFSSGAVCLVLASEVYQPEDYIRDYNEFLAFRGINKKDNE